MRVAKEDRQDTGWKSGRKAVPRPKIKRPRVRLQLHVLCSESYQPYPPCTSAERLRRYSNKRVTPKTNSIVRSTRRSLPVSSSKRHPALTGKSRGKIAKQLSRLCTVRLFFLFGTIYIFENTSWQFSSLCLFIFFIFL